MTRNIQRAAVFFVVFIIGTVNNGYCGTTYVTNNNDSDTGSLRTGITSANLNPGTTVAWTTAGGGEITLLSTLTDIGYDTTLDVSAATTAVTIAATSYSMGLGGTVTLVNDNVSKAWTINENITGAGTLVKDGDGELSLTAVNSYAGGTAVNGGTLVVNADGALGAAAGGLAFNGGTLAITSSFSTTRSVILNPGGGALDTNAHALYLAGLISGPGALRKKGLGTLTLGSANTYLGATSISSGTLALGVNNAVSAVSTVTLSSDGTLDLAGYTQTLAAISGSGTLALRLRDTPGFVNLTVAGIADVNGQTLSVTYAAQLIAAGQNFTPITAGTLTGNLAAIASPALVSFSSAASTASSLVLTASLVPFSAVAANGNQAALGAVLEPLRTSPTGDMLTVMGNLYTLDTAALRSALDQIGPVSLVSMRSLAFGASESGSAALRARYADLACGGGAGLTGYNTTVQAGASDYEDLGGGVKVAGGGSTGGLGVYAALAGMRGRVIRNATAVGDLPGYDFYGGGVYGGADYGFSEALSVGFLGGYNMGSADVKYPSAATVDANSLRYGLYALGRMWDMRLGLYAGGASDSFETGRAIVFNGVSRKAKGTTEGTESNLEAELAYDQSGRGSLVPFCSLNYDRLETDAFTEKGADSLDLSVRSLTASSMRGAAGFRFSELISYSGTATKTDIGAAWRHEFKDQSLPITSSFSSASAFTVNSGDTARNALYLSASVSSKFGESSSAFLAYTCDLRRRLTTHAGSFGIGYKF